MGEMSINLGKTEQIAGKITSLGKDLRDYSDRIEQVSDRLRRNHGVSIDFLCDKINLQNEEVVREAAKMDRLSDSLSSIVVKYRETENKIAGYEKTSLESVIDGGPIFILFDPKIHKVLGPGCPTPFEQLMERLKEIKKILKALDKVGDVSGAGVLENGISYIESLLGFLTGDKKGITGASDWFDLADSSVSVWTGLYEYFKKKYENVNAGIFSAAAEGKVAVVGVAAGVLALISTMLSAKNTGKVADYIEGGKDILSIIKAEYKLRHIGDTQSLSKIKAGIWSALDVYTAVGEAAVKSIAQAFRSYDEYSADGQWSTGDTGATGIDISTAGLYALADKLTLGFADAFFRAVDKISGGHYDPNVNYGEKAAEGYKIIAEETGKAIGNLLKRLRR